MENNSILDIENIRKKLEEDILEILSDIFKRGGMYHYFRDMYGPECEGCEMKSIEVYQDTIHLLDSIENIINTFPNDYKTILSGEFNSRNSEGLPLFVYLDLAISFCNHTKYILSAEEMERFQNIIFIARNVEFSDKFNKNWHVSDKVYINAGSDMILHFASCAIKENYRDRLGHHEFNSTIQTFNRLRYGCTAEKSNNKYYLHPDEEYLICYDFVKFPELECDPIWIADIKNTTYKYGSWQASSHSSICPLFQEQDEELEKRYKILREKITAFKEEKRNSNFKILLPYLVNAKLNTFILSENINWQENEHTRKMAQKLELVYTAAREYYEDKEIDFSSIMEQNNFNNLSEELNYIMQDFIYCERAAKQERVKALIECYMQSSQFAKNIFHMNGLTKEELEQRLMQLSLEDLYICSEKVNTKFMGVQYIRKYILMQ